MTRPSEGPSSADKPKAGASVRPEPAPKASKRFLPDDVRLGHINGVFGLRGDVRLYLYNPATDLVGQRVDVVLVAPDGAREPIELQIRPGSGKRVLARIPGVTTPEAAAALKDHELVVPDESLPEPEHGEWYHRDLIGTPVRTESGDELGRIREIVSGPGMDTWVVRGPKGTVWVHARIDDLLEVEPPDHVVVRDDAPLFV